MLLWKEHDYLCTYDKWNFWSGKATIKIYVSPKKSGIASCFFFQKSTISSLLILYVICKPTRNMKHNSHTGLDCECTQPMSPYTTLTMIYQSHSAVQYEPSPVHAHFKDCGLLAVYEQSSPSKLSHNVRLFPVTTQSSGKTQTIQYCRCLVF